MARVLVVEDDASVREAVTMVLERAAFEVRTAADGAEAVVAAFDDPPVDVIVLDLTLPTMDGFDVCREIRRSSGVPIVMLTARGDVTDVVAGLELGADDYLVKPFKTPELTARIRAVLRRSSALEHGPTLFARDLEIDADAVRCRRGGADIHLTPIEFKLLLELARCHGARTRDELLSKVWGYEWLGDSRIVDMAIKRLRDKLGAPPSPPAYIATIRGFGYRWERG